jgi:hypothetical protein
VRISLRQSVFSGSKVISHSYRGAVRGCDSGRRREISVGERGNGGLRWSSRLISMVYNRGCSSSFDLSTRASCTTIERQIGMARESSRVELDGVEERLIQGI